MLQTQIKILFFLVSIRLKAECTLKNVVMLNFVVIAFNSVSVLCTLKNLQLIFGQNQNKINSIDNISKSLCQRVKRVKTQKSTELQVDFYETNYIIKYQNVWNFSRWSLTTQSREMKKAAATTTTTNRKLVQNLHDDHDLVFTK